MHFRSPREEEEEEEETIRSLNVGGSINSHTEVGNDPHSGEVVE